MLSAGARADAVRRARGGGRLCARLYVATAELAATAASNAARNAFASAISASVGGVEGGVCRGRDREFPAKAIHRRSRRRGRGCRTRGPIDEHARFQIGKLVGYPGHCLTAQALLSQKYWPSSGPSKPARRWL